MSPFNAGVQCLISERLQMVLLTSTKKETNQNENADYAALIIY